MNVALISGDDNLRLLLSAELTELDNDVECFGSWAQAQETLERGGTPPDRVLFDIQREEHPQGALQELARHVSRAAVVVLTGPGGLQNKQIRQLGFARVLSRPCPMRDLIAAVRPFARP